VFYPESGERDDHALVKRLFYYARPGTPRNAFELAAAALRKVKAEMGDRVQIICAGTGWDPEEFDLASVVESVGLLPYRETGNLYRSCHAGFVMMMTKHPSYLPFELMACGTTVVTNHNNANTWLLRDGSNCLLSPPTANCLAQTLVYALENHAELEGMRKTAAEEMERRSSWDESLARVASFMDAPVFAPSAVSIGSQFHALANR
jgi:glycosyltransferase involved in cell wall biosynthesis